MTKDSVWLQFISQNYFKICNYYTLPYCSFLNLKIGTAQLKENSFVVNLKYLFSTVICITQGTHPIYYNHKSKPSSILFLGIFQFHWKMAKKIKIKIKNQGLWGDILFGGTAIKPKESMYRRYLDLLLSNAKNLVLPQEVSSVSWSYPTK